MPWSKTVLPTNARWKKGTADLRPNGRAAPKCGSGVEHARAPWHGLHYMQQTLTSPDGTPASRLAFGTMQFGGTADASQSRAMFDACRAAGITHFDTAHVYTDGASETLLGQFVQECRDEVVIATKAGYTGGSGRANPMRSAETARSGKRRVGEEGRSRWAPEH